MCSTAHCWRSDVGGGPESEKSQLHQTKFTWGFSPAASHRAQIFSWWFVSKVLPKSSVSHHPTPPPPPPPLTHPPSRTLILGMTTLAEIFGSSAPQQPRVPSRPNPTAKIRGANKLFYPRIVTPTHHSPPHRLQLPANSRHMQHG